MFGGLFKWVESVNNRVTGHFDSHPGKRGEVTASRAKQKEHALK